MSTIPVCRQTRRTLFLADGSARFEVTSQIVDSGDLPFPHLFVLTVSDSSDPKDDVLARVADPTDIRQADPTAPMYVKVLASDLTYLSTDLFARIANVNDVSRLPRDRVTAVRQGLTSYLATSMSLVYDNITTADAAGKQVLDRLSSLVDAWRSAKTNFLTEPYQDYNLPTSPVSIESERVAVYSAAKTSRIEAETSRDRIQAEKTACEQGCSANRAIHAFLVSDVALLDAAHDKVVALTETGSTNVKDYVLQQGAFVSDASSYETLRSERRTARDSYAALVAACEVNCDALALQLLDANRAVVSARTAETEALGSVIDVCPTFDPDSV